MRVVPAFQTRARLVGILAPHDPSRARGAVAQVGVDVALEGEALQDALRSATATRRYGPVLP
jgi:hypothetical protein